MTNGRNRELLVPYHPREKALYKAEDPQCAFHGAYPRALWHGIYQHGRFPDVVVRAAFLQLGYRVLMSDPDMPHEDGYILTHYAGKREESHPAFKRMAEFFSQRRIDELNRQCDRLKERQWGNRGGGDPDLFVISPRGRRFFVEVKDRDKLSPKQKAIFRKIKAVLGCDVLVARVRAAQHGNAADALRERLAGYRPNARRATSRPAARAWLAR